RVQAAGVEALRHQVAIANEQDVTGANIACSALLARNQRYLFGLDVQGVNPAVLLVQSCALGRIEQQMNPVGQEVWQAGGHAGSGQSGELREHASRLRYTIQGTVRAGREDNHSARAPRTSAAVLCFAHRLDDAAGNVRLLQPMIGKKTDIPAVRRPEWISRP